MATETRPTSSEVLSPERRVFITRSASADGTGVLLVAVPIIGFLIDPLIRHFPGMWRPVGDVDSFKVGETVKVNFRDPLHLPGLA